MLQDGILRGYANYGKNGNEERWIGAYVDRWATISHELIGRAQQADAPTKRKATATATELVISNCGLEISHNRKVKRPGRDAGGTGGRQRYVLAGPASGVYLCGCYLV